MSARLKPPTPMTVAEFLDWSQDQDDRWQLIDGEPVLMAPPSTTHSRIQATLATLLNNHLWPSRPDCSAFTAPGIAPRARRDSNVRIPDVVVQCGITPGGEALLEAPIITAEILSAGNRAKTWANVWTYTTIPSVEEILVVHTGDVAAELLRRRPDGNWPERFAPVGAVLELPSIGFAVPLIGIYRGTALAHG